MKRKIISAILAGTLFFTLSGMTVFANKVQHTKEEMFKLYDKPVIDYNAAVSTGTGPGEAFDKNKSYKIELFDDGFDLLCSDTESDFEPWKRIQFETASNGVIIKTFPRGSGIDGVDGAVVKQVPIWEGRGKDCYPDSPYKQAYYEKEFDYFGEKPPVAFTSKLSKQVPLATEKRNMFIKNGPAYNLFYDEYYMKYAKQISHYYVAFDAGMSISDTTDPDDLWFVTEAHNTYGWSMGWSDEKKRTKAFAEHMLGYDKWDFAGDRSLTDEDKAKYRIPGCWGVSLFHEMSWYEMSMSDWDMIHQCIREVTPDAEEIFATIYKDYHEGAELIQEFDTWYPIGKDSHIMQRDFRNETWVTYYFY